MNKKILVFLNNNFNKSFNYLDNLDKYQINSLKKIDQIEEHHEIDYLHIKEHNIYYVLTKNIIDIEIDKLIILINMMDIIILSGGPQHLMMNEKEKYPEVEILITIIKICDILEKLLIGICLGCQLIGLTYNIPIIKLNELHIGQNFLDLSTLNMDIIKQDKFLNKIDFNLLKYSFSYHNDGISNFQTNKNIDILAYSSTGVPYIIKHKIKPIYGFQFHPEATIKSISKSLKNSDIKFDINSLDDNLLKNINKIFFDSFTLI